MSVEDTLRRTLLPDRLPPTVMENRYEGPFPLTEEQTSSDDIVTFQPVIIGKVNPLEEEYNISDYMLLLPAIEPLQGDPEGNLCCVCFDQEVPSQDLEGCLHPVCTKCKLDLEQMACPACLEPLSQEIDYVDTLIKSKLSEDRIRQKLREDLIALEDQEQETIEEFYTPSYNPVGYLQPSTTRGR